MDRSPKGHLLAAMVLLLVARPVVLEEALEISYQSLKRLHQLQQVKARILDGLHLDGVPTLPKGITRPTVQKALSQLHKAVMPGQNPNFEYPEHLAVILFSEPAKSLEDKNTLQFQLNGNGNGSPIEVKSASLFIRIKTKKSDGSEKPPKSNKSRKKNNSQRKIKLLIRHFDRKRKRFRRVTLLKASIRKTKWLKLHIPQSSVERDLNSGNKTILLKVTCKRCKQSLSLDLLYKKNAKKNKIGKRRKSKKRRLSHTRPFLVVYTKPQVSTRPRRNLDDCSSANVSHCCTRQMYVDFREIGWDNWILYPPGFTTSTCDGRCVTSTPHVVTSNQASRGRNSTNQEVACRPTSSEPLTVVYYKRINVIVRRTIPNLVDGNCGCV
ncbi:inhibin beta A chain-like [Haliotis rubra]|uniref:inhibin beta A chain-like n=1 Tax=Haliotis rubra TaxID=36100 RepID=UPI001EE61CAD|nr:inhibin beta A chain-like [Haliotis rubra]